MSTLSDHEFDRSGMESGRLAVSTGGGCFLHQRGLGAVFQNDQRVVQVDRTLFGEADQAEQGGIHLHALRHV